MELDKKRERRRRIAQLEIERMIARYPYECGEPIIRKATEKEMNKVTNNKLSQLNNKVSK